MVLEDGLDVAKRGVVLVASRRGVRVGRIDVGGVRAEAREEGAEAAARRARAGRELGEVVAKEVLWRDDGGGRGEEGVGGTRQVESGIASAAAAVPRQPPDAEGRALRGASGRAPPLSGSSVDLPLPTARESAGSASRSASARSRAEPDIAPSAPGRVAGAGGAAPELIVGDSEPRARAGGCRRVIMTRRRA
jgi:hypothetical protein